LILTKFFMNDNIIKTPICYNVMFDLKGYIRLNKAKDPADPESTDPDPDLHHCYKYTLLVCVLFKNVSSSISHKKTPWLRDFSFFLSSIFVYEPILKKKLSMDANIIKTQIFHKIKYDLIGHWRSQKVFFVFKN
jgi:hypothetical protein